MFLLKNTKKYQLIKALHSKSTFKHFAYNSFSLFHVCCVYWSSLYNQMLVREKKRKMQLIWSCVEGGVV